MAPLAGIYKITHIKSFTVYVGSSINVRKRWRGHVNGLNKQCHHCTHLQRAWNKYGQEAFEFTKLEDFHYDKDKSMKDNRILLLAREQFWMDSFPKKYNTCPTAGNSLGVKATARHRKKISDALAGVSKSEAHCAALSEAQRLRIRTPEEIDRWAKNRTGSIQSENHKSKKNAAQRETKARKTAEEKRQTYERYAETKGSIVWIDGVRYLSLAEAEKILGISKYFLRKKLS